MGKKAKMKLIRRLATQLPASEKRIITSETLSGLDVIEMGVSEVQGVPVTTDQQYKRKKIATIQVNHSKELKRLYNKHGIRGIGAYVDAVNTITAQENEMRLKKVEQLKEKVEQSIDA